MITITDQAERIHALRYNEIAEITIGHRTYEVTRVRAHVGSHEDDAVTHTIQVGPMTVEFHTTPDRWNARDAGGGQQVAFDCESSDRLLEVLAQETAEHEAWLARHAADRKARARRRAEIKRYGVPNYLVAWNDNEGIDAWIARAKADRKARRTRRAA